MRRRAFAAGALAFAAVPLDALGQQSPRVPRVAYVTYLEADDFRSEALVRGLAELGYEIGRNLKLEVFKSASIATVAEAVAKSLASRPDLIVAVNSPTALAAKAARNNDPDSICRSCRSHRDRPRRQLGTARRQHHRAK